MMLTCDLLRVHLRRDVDQGTEIESIENTRGILRVHIFMHRHNALRRFSAASSSVLRMSG